GHTLSSSLVGSCILTSRKNRNLLNYHNIHRRSFFWYFYYCNISWIKRDFGWCCLYNNISRLNKRIIIFDNRLVKKYWFLFILFYLDWFLINCNGSIIGIHFVYRQFGNVWNMYFQRLKRGLKQEKTNQ